jgi:bifunctional non-homologous end joining protein LigD
VLQNELKGRSKKIVMVAFDLLYLNGYDLWKLPLPARKAALKKLVAGTDIQFSESFDVDGQQMFEHAVHPGWRASFSFLQRDIHSRTETPALPHSSG